ncbi:NADPH-dependent FMN reductase [Fictibacillus barbaricus]|uniref:Azobenzene reductase n=1 Tax=Fictibacillus barbaricus TaxID=182136 RepID=A0ABU1U489_9BACL|nr:NAD(P)H-dependent oxidoreductase [Fictibacillus barbaricus]MDR7074221.1 azobenzene reductase [Fictibacillus barbaricus]
MRIALVCGSVREVSSTRSLLKQLEKFLDDVQEVKVDFFDLKETPLPIFDGSLENRKQAESFVERMNLADCLIVASPEYHNSFSGVLKNAFDFVSGEQIKGKPIGIIATSGGGKGGINCLNSMRTFLRGLYGMVLAEQIVVDGVFFEDGRCINVDLLEKINDLTNEVIDFANMLQLRKNRPDLFEKTEQENNICI